MSYENLTVEIKDDLMWVGFGKFEKKFEVFPKNFQEIKNEIFIFQNKKQEISLKNIPRAEKEQKT